MPLFNSRHRFNPIHLVPKYLIDFMSFYFSFQPIPKNGVGNASDRQTAVGGV